MSVHDSIGAKTKTKRRSMTTNGKGVFDAYQAAEFLGAHVETVRRLARRHEIPSYKIGKDWRFREHKLQYWSETHHIRAREPVILVVGDNGDIRDRVRTSLAPDGYRVVAAADHAEVLAVVQHETPDALILDLKMNDKTGIKVLRLVRQKQLNIPVIAVIDQPKSGLLAELLRYSPITLLPKPVEHEVVRKTVRLILEGTKRR